MQKLATLALSLLPLLVLSQNSFSAETRKPNVVIFLADDAGWGDYSSSGNQQVKTPHIDSLAANGVKLDRFFVCPVCSPTRAEFLTGRYHSRTGVYGVSTGQERLNLDERTLADAFRAAGYATGAFGKWHNGSQWPYHPNARGFEEYYGFTSGHWGEYFDPPLEHNGQPVRGKGYITDLLTDKALEFINRHHDKPFLCYVPYNTPHSPWAVPESDWARHEDQPLTQKATDPTQENADHTRCALAMVENQDANIGRVLKRLEELKLAENTIVVYFSDNGPNTARFNGGMRGRKGTTDDGGVRSVCYLRYPKLLPGGRSVTQITGAIDLYPTLLALAGVPRTGDKPLDGRDLSPLLQGQPSDWPARTLFHTWAGKVSARTQTHRLDDQGRLYDMLADPGQTQPLNEAQPKLAAELTAAVAQWRQEVLLGGKAASQQPGSGGKGKAKTAGGAKVDPRPIPVGYREFPRTWLPARDGEPRGGVKRSSGAPNCSYFVNWISVDDAMVWNVTVNSPGEYLVEIDYTCAAKDVGAKIELALNGQRLAGTIAPAWDPPLYTNQDTLPRPPAESTMKPFRTLKLGSIRLEPGSGELTLRALEIPGQEVMHVRAVTLMLLK